MKFSNFESIEEWNKFIRYSTYTTLAVYLIIGIGVLQITFLLGYIGLFFLVFIAIIVVINRRWLIEQKGKNYFILHMLLLSTAFILMLLTTYFLLSN